MLQYVGIHKNTVCYLPLLPLPLSTGVCCTALLVPDIQCLLGLHPNRWYQPDHLQPDIHLPAHHRGQCGRPGSQRQHFAEGQGLLQPGKVFQGVYSVEILAEYHRCPVSECSNLLSSIRGRYHNHALPS